MGRPFYSYEIDDPDLDWLISNFLYERPDYCPIETGMLPVVLIPQDEEYWDADFLRCYDLPDTEVDVPDIENTE